MSRIPGGTARLFIDGVEVGAVERVSYSPTSAPLAMPPRVEVDFGTDLSRWVDTVHETVRSISMPHFRYPIRVEVERREYGPEPHYYFTIRTTVPSREDGTPIPVLAHESFPCSLIVGHGDARRFTLELVRRMLLKFAEHEIDECFLVGGNGRTRTRR